MTKLREKIRPFLFWIAISAPILVVTLFGYFEYSGRINYINPDPPYEMLTAAQLIGASFSIFLTYGLVILYRQQAQLQSNQEDLMKNEHKPKVELVNASTPENYKGDLRVKLSNSGKGTATNLKARIDIDVKSDIDVKLMPKWQKLTRDLDHNQSNSSTDKERIFYSSGEYLSPEEGEIIFRYPNDIDARQLNGGKKTVDNASSSTIHYYYARVNNDELDLSPPGGSDARDVVHNSIDFDRIRLKCLISYNDIDGEAYQREIIDYLIPVIHGENKEVLFELGMPYEEFTKRQQQEIFQRVNYDPLESKVKYHFDVDTATEILPSEEDNSN